MKINDFDPEVKFSCSYKPLRASQGAASSCGDFLSFGLGLGFFFIFAVAAKAIAMVLFILLMIVLVIVSSMKSTLDQSIQVTPTEFRVVRSDGRILNSFALKNIRAIHAPDRDTIKITVQSDILPSMEQKMIEDYTFRTVGDTYGLLEAVSRFGGVRSADLPVIPEVSPQIPAVSRSEKSLPVLSEAELNEFRAAEHLVQQGRISPEQLAGMYSQPEPQQAQRLSQDEINARNAAAYMQRQEMLAQQLGSAPVNDAQMKQKENENHERTGFI